CAVVFCLLVLSFFSLLHRPLTSTLFPYTTLFRSQLLRGVLQCRGHHLQHDPVRRSAGQPARPACALGWALPPASAVLQAPFPELQRPGWSWILQLPGSSSRL